MNAQIENTVVEFKKNPKTAGSCDSVTKVMPAFFAQLRRRNVLRTAATYIVVAWVIAQVADVLCDGFVAPDWAMRAVLIALALGLPIAIIISWYFEFTASFEWDPDTYPIGAITRQKGRKIDFVIISVLTLTVSMLLVWRPGEISEAEMVCIPEQSYSQSLADKTQAIGKATPN